MMFVRVGSKLCRHSKKSDVGSGSREQEVGYDFKIVVFNSASIYHRVKQSRHIYMSHVYWCCFINVRGINDIT